jgi:DNA-binding MarR family transcriptional regulator
MSQGRKAGKREVKETSRSSGGTRGTDAVSPNLFSLHRALTVVRRTVAPDITVQRLMILLSVYANEGLSQRELLERLDGCSITALSRNLADLSRLTSKKRPGPGLVEARSDPMNLRVRRVYMTPKGRRLVDRIERALAGEASQSTKARSKT